VTRPTRGCVGGFLPTCIGTGWGGVNLGAGEHGETRSLEQATG